MTSTDGRDEIEENREEEAYLNALREIISAGSLKKNRTGISTSSIFGKSLSYSLTNSKGEKILPLLTTRKMAFTVIAKELLWFLSGSTDAKVLQDKGVKIWDGNSSRQALDKAGLAKLREGDIGAGYGFQWRHYGATYTGCDSEYTGLGVDQIKGVIDSIVKDPFSRRHLVSAWNPVQISEMALPPCHVVFQFNVDADDEDINLPKYLDCCLYQRSGDMPLGIPFNIASYSLLTHMIAQQTGLTARRFIHMIGDSHIYMNQIDGTLEQCKRTANKFPLLIMPYPAPADIFSYRHTDFKLENYKSYPEIKYPMAV